MNSIYSAAHSADNLLLNCAGLQASESLLIVAEDPALGWYDADVIETIEAAAGRHGFRTRTLGVGAPRNRRAPEVEAAMREHDCTLFLSRIGDQDRFATPPPGKRIVMCYLRSADMLRSAFGGVEYAATAEIKATLDTLLARARRIEISCPHGSACRIEQPPCAVDAAAEVTVRRFPLGVVTPIDASGLSGRVALYDYLTPTGSSVYQPADLALDGTVFAEVEAGRIRGFDGEAHTVARVESHYRNVADLFGIDAGVVHSWHAGLHPGLCYRQPAAANPDRWSNTVFNHPRILHFHTCGAYAPGEICWMLKDHTVTIDGKALWRDGVLRVFDFDELGACLQRWPELESLYTASAGEIGI